MNTGDETTSPAGTALVQRLFGDVFNGRALEALDDIVAVDYHEHALAPFEDVEPGLVDGPAHMRHVVEWLLAQFPDLTMDILETTSDSASVAVRVRSEGTNRGPLNGFLPPTGRRFSAEQAHWYRVVDGRLAEHWAVRDDLRTMVQLGVVARPGPAGQSGRRP